MSVIKDMHLAIAVPPLDEDLFGAFKRSAFSVQRPQLDQRLCDS
jgi:hypothetical protein